MTNSHIEAANSLLDPAQLFDPAEIAADPSLVPKVKGIYAWWLDVGILPAVPTDGCLTKDGRVLLYVGIAPSRTVGVRTLRDRLKDHCRGPIGRSTLRRTLTTLLAAEQGWTVTRSATRRQVMSAVDEAALSSWMAAHARVVWLAHDSPWELEHQLITEGPRLPLNIAGSADTFRAVLSGQRRQMGRAES